MKVSGSIMKLRGKIMNMRDLGFYAPFVKIE